MFEKSIINLLLNKAKDLIPEIIETFEVFQDYFKLQPEEKKVALIIFPTKETILIIFQSFDSDAKPVRVLDTIDLKNTDVTELINKWQKEKEVQDQRKGKSETTDGL